MPRYDLVLEVLDGCAEFAAQEASRCADVRIISPTELRAQTEDLAASGRLRGVVAVHAAVQVPARRPRELLETSVMHQVDELIEQIRRLRPRPRFTGVRLAAAGSDTPDMQRILQRVAEGAGLPVEEDGDLLVRVRRPGSGGTPPTPHSATTLPQTSRAGTPDPATPPAGAGGPRWEILVRTTPRPLSRRPWRVVDYPGAVNATIAATAMGLMDVSSEDVLLDMTCGSGTLLIEQLHAVAPSRAIGVDLSEQALDAARRHQRAARRKGRIDWIQGDVLQVPLDGPVSRFVANPPWGEIHGEHASNEELLEGLLRRAAELSAPQARLGILTHEIVRMHAVLERTEQWAPRLEHRFFQKGHHPRFFVLERTSRMSHGCRS